MPFLIALGLFVSSFFPAALAGDKGLCGGYFKAVARASAAAAFAMILTQDTPDQDGYDNWAEVYPGSRVYRSRMLSPERLEERLKDYDIKTLLVLDELPQYEAELATKYGVAVVHLPMVRDPYPASNFLDTIRKSFQIHERPILVHCRHGADRTGAVCALYLFEEEGLEKDEAKQRALCLRFGHCGSLTHPNIHRFWKDYKKGDWEPYKKKE
jgi:hypothetical protein